MENINSISPGFRDTSLIKNIGKYNQIDERLTLPIGKYFDFYEQTPIKTVSTAPDGLLSYINNTKTFEKTGELEESITLSSLSKRDTNSIDLGYNDVQPQKYSYLEGETYQDPKDKNWISMGVNAALGYALGDSVGISASPEGVNIASSSLELSTNLIARTAEYLLGNSVTPLGASNLTKIGLMNIGTSFANSVAQKARISSGVNDFFKKPVGFFDAVDTLELDKFSGFKTPGNINGFSEKMLPLYFYTEVRNDNFNKYGEVSWINKGGYDTGVVDIITGKNIMADELLMFGDSSDNNPQPMTLENLSVSSNSLLSKTQKLFQSGKIESMVTDTIRYTSNGDKNVNENNPQSKGRNLIVDGDSCRSWTRNNQYNKLSSLIRPLGTKTNTYGQNLKDVLDISLKRVRPGADALNKFSVLQNDGFVKISPYKTDDFKKEDQRDVKKYMFSLENLAWKGSIDSLIEGTSQEGPNGGRIMWFPPYDINFNESVSVELNKDVFIGRGEPVYSYSNTERGGTLNFKVIVDHPSLINYYKQDKFDSHGHEIVDNDYLNFFAGCDVLELTGTTDLPVENKPIEKKTPVTNPSVTMSFKVYFPNNYSGVYDGYKNAISYLYQGDRCSLTGGKGYENDPGSNLISPATNPNDWKGLTHIDDNTPCFSSDYYYRVDTHQILTEHQYKDTRSFGLNNKKCTPGDSNSYSFREVYAFMSGKTEGESQEYLAKKAKADFYRAQCDWYAAAFEKDDSTNDYMVEIAKIPESTDKPLYKARYEKASKDYDVAYSNYQKAKAEDIKRNGSGGLTSNLEIIKQENGKSNTKNNTQSLDGLKKAWEEYEKQSQDVTTKLNICTNIKNELLLLAGSQFNSKLIEYNNASTVYNNALADLSIYESVVIDEGIVYYNTAESETFNVFWDTLKQATSVALVGSASKHGKETQNLALVNNRCSVIKDWLKICNPNDSIYKEDSAYSTATIQTNKDTSSEEAKKDRFVQVIIKTGGEAIDTEKEVKKSDSNYTTGVNITGSTNSGTTSNPIRQKKSMYGYYYDPSDPTDKSGKKLNNDEAMFFEKLSETSIGKIIEGKLSEKIKYFNPAFHSTTPEGFNSRLTFLHQCTRQGPTSDATNTSTGKKSATNMAFGRPPVCVLRLGDFYNTKIMIESLNIDYDPLVWDLNQEGIGVQPMLASISMSFKFIGGSDLTGPIARLQNAITSNFFANTGVYDDRNDRITSHSVKADTNNPMAKQYSDDYDVLYNPGVYDPKPNSNK